MELQKHIEKTIPPLEEAMDKYRQELKETKAEMSKIKKILNQLNSLKGIPRRDTLKKKQNILDKPENTIPNLD